MSEKKSKLKEDGTLAGCIGENRPIPPNVCKTCAKSSDLTCRDVKKALK